jgi:nitrate reductase / nitrite oxidoreductase, beta subunit
VHRLPDLHRRLQDLLDQRQGQEQIFWNNVETKPWGGYPVGWDVKLLEKTEPAKWERQAQAHQLTIFETDRGQPPRGYNPQPRTTPRPTSARTKSRHGRTRRSTSGTHPMWMFYLARICNHCDHPACVAACPRKAIYKREEDGIVLVDQERCRGYQECVKACPYKKVFYNVINRASEKCIGCYPRVEQGEVALCVESCIGKIRMHGFLTTEGEPREDNPLDYIVKIRKLALPLYPQHGTGPNVYYIPPLHVPNGFLDQLFGPASRRPRNCTATSPTTQLLGALLLFGASNRIITRFEVYEGEEAVGWDVMTAREVARVPFTEPMSTASTYDLRPTRHCFRHRPVLRRGWHPVPSRRRCFVHDGRPGNAGAGLLLAGAMAEGHRRSLSGCVRDVSELLVVRLLVCRGRLPAARAGIVQRCSIAPMVHGATGRQSHGGLQPHAPR